jgi:hypothetical protein
MTSGPRHDAGRYWVRWGPPVIDPVLNGGMPEVTAADALDDRSWFAGHPDRRFRARADDGGAWFVRRRGEVLLRTFAPPRVKFLIVAARELSRRRTR